MEKILKASHHLKLQTYFDSAARTQTHFHLEAENLPKARQIEHQKQATIPCQGSGNPSGHEFVSEICRRDLPSSPTSKRLPEVALAEKDQSPLPAMQLLSTSALFRPGASLASLGASQHLLRLKVYPHHAVISLGFKLQEILSSET